MGTTSPNSEKRQITDINERRKLQNRVAQRKYRTRQKTRMKLAEAVLNDYTYIHPTLGTIQSKKKSPLTMECDRSSASYPDLSSYAEICSETRSETQATRARQLTSQRTCFRESVDNNQADSHAQLSRCLNRQEMFYGISGETEFSEGDTRDRVECIDPNLTRGWLDMDLRSGTPNSSTVVDCGLCTVGANSQPPTRTNVQEAIETLELFEPNDQRKTENLPREPCGSCPSSSHGYSPTSGNPSTLLLTPSESLMNSVIVTSDSPLLAADDKSPGDLVISEANTHGPKEDQFSPLMTAISLGRLDIARILLQSGAPLDIPDDSGKTALHRAVGRRELHMVEALLNLGAEMLATDHEGNSLLHIAVKTNSLSITRLLLERYKSCRELKDAQLGHGCRQHGNQVHSESWIDLRNREGMTAVHLSVIFNRPEILQLLVKYSANVN
ncbi:hypothetical protein COCCADRAFT_113496 [Bipolaris zeicola 26-R-13]|uniref:Transcription factor TOXE n=2 Tax=Cochliobolus carbonum TaxID=5017 RepID=TOXE_COCCA|nr:uncharacterized protein COCCADRAFT_113496 [Bipolaris zeicola 26-R-13]O74205.1 RecName: Full=Transcription factor TOXE; AltName: Full=TOX2 HC-toxin biosynthesis cluster protein TOXE [Bipolaris zeicola]AAD13811.1 TOXE protein [Bipolaris zeicola]EUC26745.1 hypothetical protein COCCADRAFT_113496 [Bipolaris zeicola 26-R-13]